MEGVKNDAKSDPDSSIVQCQPMEPAISHADQVFSLVYSSWRYSTFLPSYIENEELASTRTVERRDAKKKKYACALGSELRSYGIIITYIHAIKQHQTKSQFFCWRANEN
jgi:hypothetical protein